MIGWSLTGAGPSRTPYGWVDLSPPIYWSQWLTLDAEGRTRLGVSVPRGASGRTVYTQAGVLEAGSLTLSGGLVRRVR